MSAALTGSPGSPVVTPKMLCFGSWVSGMGRSGLVNHGERGRTMQSVLESLLNLPRVRVLSGEFTAQGDLIIRVESTRRGTSCRRCGREIDPLHGYDRPLRLRHLPIFERRVHLEIRPRRYRCGHCQGGPTTTRRLEWYEPNSPCTRAFEQAMLRGR